MYIVKYFVCYDMSKPLSKESIDIINGYNSLIDDDWVNVDYGINYYMLYDNKTEYRGTRRRTLNGNEVWILPFVGEMSFINSVNGVYDIFTEEGYNDDFKNTLDPLPTDDL